ncbi:MAG: hypothetical protein ACOCQD_03060 [archaeon]
MGFIYRIHYITKTKTQEYNIHTKDITAGNIRDALFLFEIKHIGKEVIKIEKVN